MSEVLTVLPFLALVALLVSRLLKERRQETECNGSLTPAPAGAQSKDKDAHAIGKATGIRRSATSSHLRAAGSRSETITI